LRAAQQLNMKVKAIVSELSDEQAVINQGQENSGHKDFTFIERARYALLLEEQSNSRDVIMKALGVDDKGYLSHMTTVAKGISLAIIDAIGRAPEIGQPRWQDLLKSLGDDKKKLRAKEIVNETSFKDELDSDQRFKKLLADLTEKKAATGPETRSADDGTVLAIISRSRKGLNLSFDDKATSGFGDFVTDRLASLFQEFKQK
jgi:ParB family transcriptional regulator, chromosome partitioning protein